MSRIGKKPVLIPQGTTVKVTGNVVDIKGPKGDDQIEFMENLLAVEVKDNQIHVTRANDLKKTKQLHGSLRAEIANAIKGTSEEFVKLLDVVGIGYRGEMKGQDLVLHVGYTHPIVIHPFDGVKISVLESKIKDVTCTIEVRGSDKFKVGQIAAEIRDARRPEVYQGKGIHYRGEHLIHKEGKRAATGSATTAGAAKK
jgi:large subunit ribosomal protein L6